MGAKDKVVIFPIFEECKAYTLDRYWVDLFSGFACNKFPPGVKYDSENKEIVLKTGGAMEKFRIPEEPSKAFSVMMTIMKDKLGLRSTRNMKTHILDKKAQMIVDDDFKANTKYVKDQLIAAYILSLKTKYKLSISEYNKVASLIKLGFQFKSISHDDIAFENREITAISGLKFDEKSRTFSIPKYGTKVVPKASKKPSVNKFGLRVDKFVGENNERVKLFLSL